MQSNQTAALIISRILPQANWSSKFMTLWWLTISLRLLRLQINLAAWLKKVLEFQFYKKSKFYDFGILILQTIKILRFWNFNFTKIFEFQLYKILRFWKFNFTNFTKFHFTKFRYYLKTQNFVDSQKTKFRYYLKIQNPFSRAASKSQKRWLKYSF